METGVKKNFYWVVISFVFFAIGAFLYGCSIIFYKYTIELDNPVSFLYLSLKLAWPLSLLITGASVGGVITGIMSLFKKRGGKLLCAMAIISNLLLLAVSHWNFFFSLYIRLSSLI